MSRVLVTGASGFIGRVLLRLAPTEWELVAVSRNAPPEASHAAWVRLEDARAAFPPALERPHDAVIHLAGSADHGLAVREPWADLEATAVTAAALLGRIRARRIVLLSSAAVYAGRTGLVDPGMAVDPPMAYALSKRYVEGFVKTLVDDGRADSALIVRLYNAYGPGERPTRLIPRVVDAARSRRTFKLTGDPASLSDPLHVDDVARALVAAVERGRTARGVVTLDLCGGDPRPLREQVDRIADAIGLPPPDVELVPDPQQTPIHFHSDPGPTIEALGLGRLEPFPDGVRRYAAASGWLA